MPENSPHVAVIGLGAMGLPMAAHLATAFPVTGFDPFAPRRERRRAEGVRAPTPRRQLLTPTSSCSPSATTRRLRCPVRADGVRRPCTGIAVILTSTVGPEAARDLAEKLDAAGIADRRTDQRWPVRAGNGDLLIVVGAEERRRRPPGPRPLSSTLTIVGPRPGDGQALKAINQLLAGVHIAAAAEAIALARGLGLDPAVVIEALSQGAAGSFMFADRGPACSRPYTGGAEVKSRVDIFVKDMGIVTSVGRNSHVPLPLAAAAQQLYLIAEAAGLGASDDSSVVTILSPEPQMRVTR